MIRILHVARDDKFFDGVYSIFEEDENFSNEAILITKKKYKIKWIKYLEKITVLNSIIQIYKKIRSKDYDYLFFHSLRADLWYLFLFIPKGKKIIWWAWGDDIYDCYYGIKPIINVDLYKSRTLQWINENTLSRKEKIKQLIKNNSLGLIARMLKNKVISRIDYFQPVVKADYELMKKNKYFHADEFYYKNSFGENIISEIPSKRTMEGIILFGNSATPTNNHLDVWFEIRDIIANNNVIVPLNYGDFSYSKFLKQTIKSSNVKFLEEFLPIEKFNEMMSNSSFWVSGIIRQQAVGNILRAISNGLTVYLYENCTLYHYFREQGFIVFSIEDLIREKKLRILTKDEIACNINCINNEICRRNLIYNKFIKENIQ